MRAQAMLLLLLATGAHTACTDLYQTDFAAGTVILDTAGCYRLAEDITFAPNDAAIDQNHPELCMFPDRTQPPYNTLGYSLGFFAAIVISGNGVTLDLNGKTLEQSEKHALCQRFYANIELASAPFPFNAGPADFASDVFQAATDVIIKNGKLGRSSHHGIHGNNNEKVTLKDLEITDFEVGGISLNKVTKLTATNINVHTTRTTVPANGRLSHAIFLLQAISSRLAGLTLSPAVLTKQAALRAALYSFLTSGIDTHNNLFAAETGGIPDASMVVGILVHPKVHVGGFLEGIPAVEDSSNQIVLKNVVVNNLQGSPGEKGVLHTAGQHPLAPASTYADAGHVHDGIGAVLDMDFVTDAANNYVANPLADLQIELGIWGRACLADPVACPASPQQQKVLNANTISQPIADWAAGTITFQELLDTGYTVVGNGDVMFHTVKGAIGIKLDGSTKVQVHDATITNIQNLSTKARRSALAMAASDYKYLGDEARGLSVAASVEVDGKGLEFRGITSNIGANTCVDLINQVEKADFRKMSLNKRA